MTLRAAPVLLALLGLLSLASPGSVWAQGHEHGGYGGGRGGGGRDGGGARGGDGGGARGGDGRGQHAGGFGGPAYGGGFPGAPFAARRSFGRQGYPGGAYNPLGLEGGYGAYGRGYPQPPYGGQPYMNGYPRFAYPGGFGGDWRSEQNEVRQAVREGRHVPLSQAIQAVRQRTPGHELDAALEPGANGRSVYRVRWAASNGRRIDYLIDAGTGAIVGVQGGR